MDGKAVYGLPDAFGGSQGHKKGGFWVTSGPWGQPGTQKWRFSCYQLSSGAARDTKMAVFGLQAALGDSCGHKKGGFWVTSGPGGQRNAQKGPKTCESLPGAARGLDAELPPHPEN